jgi:HEAT repeat protein
MRHQTDRKVEQKKFIVLLCMILTIALSPALTACATKAWYKSYGFDSREDINTIASVPVLIDALGDHNPKVRMEVANTLAQIGPDAKDAVPALIEVLKDNDFNVRQAAADALDAIELKKQSLADEAEIKKIRLLVNTTRLESKNRIIQKEALDQLADIGHEAVVALPELIRIIEDRSDWRDNYYNPVLKGAVVVLGNIGPEARVATPALIKLMDNKDFAVRIEVVKALGKIGPGTDSALIEALIQAVRGDPELIVLRDNFAKLLPSSYEYLAYKGITYGDPDCDVRREAAASLGRFGTDAVAAVPALLDATLTDINENVKRQAAFSLCRIQPGSGAAMIALEKAINDKDGPFTREAALLELRNVPQEYRTSWLPRILYALDDIEEDVRLNAVKTLAEYRIGNETVCKALRRLALEDKSLTVKAEAQKTLNYLKDVQPAE